MNKATIKNSKRVVVVGGVAGGASCAARLRRLDEQAEIIVIERGPYVSFANCGLPYHVGGVIEEESRLLVADAKLFRERFRIEVRELTEAVEIDRTAQRLRLRDLRTLEETWEKYDALVLAPGASPVRPPLPGIDLPGIFTVRNIPDARAIRKWIDDKRALEAVVVGGGFIGLEMAENLVHRGLKVTVVEMLDQVMPPLDADIAGIVGSHLRQVAGVRLALGDGVAGFEKDGGRLVVVTQSGGRYPADLVILAIGVRPETSLAKAAGLEIGARGGFVVDDQMRTSDSAIWAVGDAVETRDYLLGSTTLLPLAGPANRQGRVAADVICGRNSKFRGVQGTAIVEAFGMSVASTGVGEKSLRRAGVQDYEKILIHPSHHAGYYPGARRMTLKLLFRKSDGVILGAQAAGFEGVDKRIDVIAMAIQKRGTVFDLEEAELCYAPQFGAAKDPVNFAGMVAADVLRGDMPLAHWENVAGFTVIDVRDPDEFSTWHYPGSRNIPLSQLRGHLSELDPDREYLVTCAVGQRGYLATRILVQNGFQARNLSGGLASAPRVADSTPKR